MTQPAHGELSVRVDTTQLRQVFIDLKAVSKELPREYTKAIKGVVAPAISAVKSSASWSSRIPGAVKTRISAGRDARVEIYVDSKLAPEAAPIDNRGRAGTFRHPVYADASQPRESWTWVSQPAIPFLEPPVFAQLAAIETGLLDVTEKVLRKAGFK